MDYDGSRGNDGNVVAGGARPQSVLVKPTDQRITCVANPYEQHNLTTHSTLASPTARFSVRDQHTFKFPAFY